MILLDTNVLVYAVGGDHPNREPAVDLVSFAYTGRLRVSARVIEEFAFVHARRGRPRTTTRELAGEWAASLGPVEFIAEEDIADGFDLWVEHADLDIADGILAAQARRLGANLVSADSAFAAVADLRFVDLADPDLRDLLDLPQS